MKKYLIKMDLISSLMKKVESETSILIAWKTQDKSVYPTVQSFIVGTA